MKSYGVSQSFNIHLHYSCVTATSIFINREDILMPINVTSQQYLILNSSIPLNVSCIGAPGGIPPMLTYTPFTTFSNTSLPVHQNASAAYIEFPGGFALPFSGVYTCTSASGYTVTSYIASPSPSGRCRSVET